MAVEGIKWASDRVHDGAKVGERHILDVVFKKSIVAGYQKTRARAYWVPIGEEEREGFEGAREGWCAGVFGIVRSRRDLMGGSSW